MTFLRVCCLMGLAAVMTQTLADEPLAVCGEAGKALDDGCWHH